MYAPRNPGLIQKVRVTLQEAAHGVAAPGNSTSFPCSLARAARCAAVLGPQNSGHRPPSAIFNTARVPVLSSGHRPPCDFEYFICGVPVLNAGRRAASTRTQRSWWRARRARRPGPSGTCTAVATTVRLRRTTRRGSRSRRTPPRSISAGIRDGGEGGYLLVFFVQLFGHRKSNIIGLSCVQRWARETDMIGRRFVVAAGAKSRGEKIHSCRRA
eukprot:SAG31_NODE_713_length_12651_cov_180.009481_6_plen_214_part_00